MTRLLLTLAALSFVLPGVAAAADDSLCGARVDIVSALSEHYQEQLTAVGQVDSQAVLEVFVSQDGTFTIIATGTDGKSCVLTSGEGWQGDAPAPGRDA